MAITTQHWQLRKGDRTATFRRTGSTIMVVIAEAGRTVEMSRLVPAEARKIWTNLEREGYRLS